MSKLVLATAALNQTPLDWAENKANILCAIDHARSLGVSVLCLPELCISGYGCEDAFFSAGIRERALRVLEEIAPASEKMIVAVGLPLEVEGKIYDAACLLVDGEIAGFTLKKFLANDGIHYEPRWFSPWPLGRRAEITIGEKKIPLGDLYYDVGGIKIGFEICEDAWVENRPARELAKKDIDIILNPSASHFAFGKYQERKDLILVGSRLPSSAYLYANLLGNEAGRAIYDGTSIIAANGEVRAEASRFSFHDYFVTAATVDIAVLRAGRAGVETSEEDGPFEIQLSFTFPMEEKAVGSSSPARWQSGANVKEEEFARAVSLGLFDYLRKSRSKGFVLSLSGGADSGAVACLIFLMQHFSMAELGVKEFTRKLSYIEKLEGLGEGEILEKLLLCVYQGTKNSSEITQNAANKLAAALGASFINLSIDSLVDNYVEMVSEALGRELNWQDDDLALQNIQARVRGPSVWLLANVKNALLLATSNRSEAAVGYTTMDGDTCGGLSPIAGIDKAYLIEWLKWLEKSGPEGLGPIPALSAINAQEPTAELRPVAQRDEQDLMPYQVLDVIERYAIRDKLVPFKVLACLEKEFSQYDKEQLESWVKKFFRLWSRNQWKRERYAPCFHLDDENLDPKTWCRFPILSGGFEEELRGL